MNLSAPTAAPAGHPGVSHMRVLEVIAPITNKHHTVELEIGDRLWLKHSSFEITTASRAELERDGWGLVPAQEVAVW